MIPESFGHFHRSRANSEMLVNACIAVHHEVLDASKVSLIF